MYVTFYDITEESGRHAKEENCETECPFCSTLREADVISNLLTEDRPTIYGTDTAMEQKRWNSSAKPFSAE
jgi:hypothetical protein